MGFFDPFEDIASGGAVDCEEVNLDIVAVLFDADRGRGRPGKPSDPLNLECGVERLLSLMRKVLDVLAVSCTGAGAVRCFGRVSEYS